MVLLPQALASAEPGVFTRAGALHAGHTDARLSTWVSEGLVRRVGRGVFAVAPPPEYAEGRLLERAKAFAHGHGPHVALSHHAALMLQDISTFAVPLHTVYAVRLAGGAQGGAGIHLERPRVTPPTLLIGGLRAVRPEVAVLQVARAFGHVAGIVSADSALSHHAITRDDLRREVKRVGAAPGIGVARVVVELCREGAESPGETRLRLAIEQMGYRTEAQCPIAAPGQSPFAFADLRIVGTRGLLEFDGSIKYEGATGRQALINEKAREDRIRGLGWHLERVVWRDLDDLPALRRRIDHLVGRAR